MSLTQPVNDETYERALQPLWYCTLCQVLTALAAVYNLVQGDWLIALLFAGQFGWISSYKWDVHG